MTETRVDFAIVGATPQAMLVAGLLAGTHGRSVVLQGETHAGHRLARNFDLSIGPITRPQSWALLGQSVADVHRLATRIGKRAAVTRLDPLLVARTDASVQALGHIRHMAAGFGIAAEPFRGTGLVKGDTGLVLRDAVMLQFGAADAAIDSWLGAQGVRRLATGEQFAIHADGSATLALETETIVAAQTILADDAALIEHMSGQGWPELLKRQVASTVMTGPVPTLAAPVLHDLDAALWVQQQAGRSLIAHGPGTIGAVWRALAGLVGEEQRFEQAGQSEYTNVVTQDGAPAVGRWQGTGPDVLAGFGSVGAFVAPAIARWLCGAATADENAWMAARLVNRNPGDGAIAEWGALS
jgi:hypothetical protein